MRLLVTGSSKLAGALLNHDWPDWCIDTRRIEEILADDFCVDEYDVFLNCAHVGFKQCWLLEKFHSAWLHDKSKYIINFSSRAAKPNISKGLLYSTQKAALNHLADMLTYTTEKRYRMTVLNLGLLERENLLEMSTSYRAVCNLLELMMLDHELGDPNETSEVTFQHRTNYRKAQEIKSEQQKKG